MKRRDAVALGVSVLLVLFVAGLGGLVTAPKGWYESLEKPAWTPPPWLFGPVWTALYLAMAVAAWLVWRVEPRGWSLRLYGVQLLLNAIWSPLFFGLRRPGLALLDLGLLLLVLVATVIAFFRVRRAAGWILVPYLAWTLFATALNLEIWRAN